MNQGAKPVQQSAMPATYTSPEAMELTVTLGTIFSLLKAFTFPDLRKAADAISETGGRTLDPGSTESREKLEQGLRGIIMALYEEESHKLATVQNVLEAIAKE